MATPPPQNTLMGLATELRLNIFKFAFQEDTLHNFERTSNPSGYSLLQHWQFLFLGHKLYRTDKQTNLMTRWGLWSSLSNISNPQELYDYRPRVPAILKTNQRLRGEGCKEYLKFAKEQMEVYEARHKELLPLFIDGYEAWKVRPYRAPGKAIGHGEGDLRVEGLELAMLCIRWFTLKGIVEFLEKESDAGVAAGGVANGGAAGGQ
jgi:hypothetical protein